VRSRAQSHAGWGVRKVHASLRRGGVVASKKRVRGVMNRLGLVPPAREPKKALVRWLVEYHTDRPHQALAWQTPSRSARNLGLPIEAAA
jgi:hypothetical protein